MCIVSGVTSKVANIALLLLGTHWMTKTGSKKALAAVGYVTEQPQPGNPCTTAVFWMTMFLWMGIPILGWLCTLVAMKFYPLDAEMMEKVQASNAALRAEGKAKKA